MALITRTSVLALGLGVAVGVALSRLDLGGKQRSPLGHADALPGVRAAIALPSGRLTAFSLPTLGDTAVRIDFPRSGPLVLVVFDESDCLSCVNLAYESWQVSRWVRSHGGVAIGIARAKKSEVVRGYARRTRLPFDIAIDSSNWSTRTLGLALHPIILFVSPTGHVVSSVLRTSSLTEQQPLVPYLEVLDTWLADNAMR
jgi:hypothetical protein